jgi:hypothetical protein
MRKVMTEPQPPTLSGQFELERYASGVVGWGWEASLSSASRVNAAALGDMASATAMPADAATGRRVADRARNDKQGRISGPNL